MQQTGLALVALAACVVLHTSEAILPIASSCCTEVSHHISRRFLHRVTACRIQKADGDCDLAAIILRVKRKRICVSLQNHIIQQWMKAEAIEKDAKGNICHKKKQSRKRNHKAALIRRQQIRAYGVPLQKSLQS